ncbi:MAG: ABC transporter permease [Armatimonadota bacterium]|nr:ABC transporter permease [Armatimonadota bacterium]
MIRSIIDAAGRFRGVLAFAIVFILGVIFSPVSYRTGHSTFLNWSTQNDILFEYAEYGILAAGMTLVIISGGIDLSVGSVLGFSATLFALLLVGYGWSASAAAVFTTLTAAVMGAVNGFIIARFKMQPFVATLGMMLIARGAAKWISGGIKVQPGAREWYAIKSGNPHIFDWMTSQTALLNLRPITLVFIASIVILWIVLRFTRFGRYIYAIGGNEEAARLSGIRVGSVKLVAYTLCGITAGLAGICNACRVTLGDPGEAGMTYELDAIAAVVIGGTSLSGGKGGMFFTFLGTLIIAYISKILSLQGIEEAPRLMIRGALIIIAVLIQQSRKE